LIVDADFINKLSGAIEEVDESALWLEVLRPMSWCVSSCDRAKRPEPSNRPRNARNQQSRIN